MHRDLQSSTGVLRTSISSEIYDMTSPLAYYGRSYVEVADSDLNQQSARSYSGVKLHVALHNKGYHLCDRGPIHDGEICTIQLAKLTPRKEEEPTIAKYLAEGGSKKVVIKTFEMAKIRRDYADTTAKIIQEVDALERTRDYIGTVNLLEIIEAPDSFLMIEEFCEYGDLEAYISRRYNDPYEWNEEKARSFFDRAVSIVKHCHDLNLVHRNIRPDNFLIDRQENIKLGGFASAMESLDTELLPVKYPSLYSSPENNRGEPHCPRKGDIWSLGVLLYFMTNLSLPFRHLDGMDKMSQQQRFPFMKDISDGCRRLISSLLQYDPGDRPTIDEIMDDPWLSAPFAPTPEPVPSPVSELPPLVSHSRLPMPVNHALKLKSKTSMKTDSYQAASVSKIPRRACQEEYAVPYEQVTLPKIPRRASCEESTVPYEQVVLPKMRRASSGQPVQASGVGYDSQAPPNKASSRSIQSPPTTPEHPGYRNAPHTYQPAPLRYKPSPPGIKPAGQGYKSGPRSPPRTPESPGYRYAPHSYQPAPLGYKPSPPGIKPAGQGYKSGPRSYHPAPPAYKPTPPAYKPEPPSENAPRNKPAIHRRRTFVENIRSLVYCRKSCVDESESNIDIRESNIDDQTRIAHATKSKIPVRVNTPKPVVASVSPAIQMLKDTHQEAVKEFGQDLNGQLAPNFEEFVRKQRHKKVETVNYRYAKSEIKSSSGNIVVGPPKLVKITVKYEIVPTASSSISKGKH